MVLDGDRAAEGEGCGSFGVKTGRGKAVNSIGR